MNSSSKQPIITLSLPHGQLQLPAFLPDGTQGVVRALDAADLEQCGIQAVQMNVFHLMQRPGSSTIQSLGGLHRMAGWTKPIFTDSGGFQVYSLLRQNKNFGSINERGATFRLDKDGRKYKLTPEKSVQLQLSYGADMVICLDECTHAEDPDAEQAAAVRRTLVWARRCKDTFEQLVAEKKLPDNQRPKLMAVVQGGNNLEMRQQCAAALLEIGFDAFGYGGWPLDSEGKLLSEMLSHVRQLIPLNYPLHALGVGHPQSIAECVRMGYTLFDRTMPTRDARHGRLYTFAEDPAISSLTGNDWFSYIYPDDKRHVKQSLPLSAYCDAPCCRRYTLGYLHHLYKLRDHLYFRLATMHNLRFMAQLLAALREKVAK